MTDDFQNKIFYGAYISLPTPVFAFPALASDVNVCH